MSNRIQGYFSALAKSAMFGTSTNGTEQLGVEVVLLDGAEKGRSVTSYLYFTDASAEYSIQKMRACGFADDDLSKFCDETGKLGFAPKPVRVSIDYETYDGKERMKVDIYGQDGGVAMKTPMGEAQRKSFGERFRKLASTVKSGAPIAKKEGAAAKPGAGGGSYDLNDPSGGKDDPLSF